MRLVRFASPEGARTGIVAAAGILDAHLVFPTLNEAAQPGDLLALLRAGQPALDQLAQTVANAGTALSEVRLLPPVADPPKIICCWVNYLEEGAAAPSERPIFFAKFPTALIGCHDPIQLPRIAGKIVVEPELTVVIGARARKIAPREALSCVAGYTIANDVTAFSHRLVELIGSRGPNMMAKTFDTFAPLGPCLVTPEEVGDPHNLRVRQWLNDELQVDANTSQMLTRIPEFISYLSEFCTLQPGDLILTGSPKPLGKLKFLGPGDRVRIAIDRIGELANPVIADAP
jgi:2-keto-4-pentenoate hydratase/2-oxohepta-3-ene-1,7-dioic acid hydratase in catechol pathway